MKNSAQNGFTLIELIVTVAIAGVLLGVAVPSFVSISVRNRITTYTNSFMGGLNFARTEAVRRGTTMTVCISTNGTSCATSGSWTNGWIIFTDQNGDGTVNGTDVVLRKFDALAATYTLGTGDFATRLSFAPNSSALSIGTFAVCHSGSTNGARAILVTRLRPRIGIDTDNDGIPNKDDGTNIASCTSP